MSLRLKHRTILNTGGVWGDDPDGVRDTVVLRSTDQTVDGGWKIIDPAIRAIDPREARKCCLQEGDILITKSSGSDQHIGKASLVTAEVANLRPVFSNFNQRIRLDKHQHPGFYWHYMNSSVARHHYVVSANSTSGLGNLNASIIGELPIPKLDLTTQRKISEFLDHETNRIDELVRAKQRVVALLSEKRSLAALHRLSDGVAELDWSPDQQSPVFRMKHPAWTVRRIKHVVQFMTSGSRGWSGFLGSEGELFIQSGNIGRIMDVNLQAAQRVEPQIGAEAERTLVRKDDVLVCITGGRTGAVGYVSDIDERAYINQHICLLRARRDTIFPKLLAHLLWSVVGQKQIEMCQYGVKQGLGFNQVADLKLPIPPLDQRARISTEIDAIVGAIDAAAEKVVKSIDTLRQLRSTLITGAVTGQIDVNEWLERGATDRLLQATEEAVHS